MKTIDSPQKTLTSFDLYKRGYVSIKAERPRPYTAPGARTIAISSETHSNPQRQAPKHSLPKISSKRILIAVLVVASILAVMLPATKAFGRRSLVSSERPSAETKSNVVSIVVSRGETLWSIAQRLEPNRDPREVVDELVQARGSANVFEGETITWAR